MKTKFVFNGKELCVAKYSFFGLIHNKEEDRIINLTDVDYIEKVALGGFFFKKFGVELVTASGESTYVPKISEMEADSLISEAVSHGAKLKEHAFRYVPSDRIMKKYYKAYCIVCDEGDHLVKKVYNKQECLRESVSRNNIGYIDVAKINYQWVGSWWGKALVATLGWAPGLISKVDNKTKSFHSIELTEVPSGTYSHSSLYIPYLSEKEANDFSKVIKDICSCSLMERKFKFVPSEKSMYKISKGYTVLMDEFGYLVKKVYMLSDCENQRVRLDDIVYLDDIKEKRIKGLAFGSVAGGGEANSIEIFGLSKEDTKTVSDMVISRNSQLTPSVSQHFTSFLPIKQPGRWIRRREKLYLTDIGLVHKQYHVTINNKFYRTRTSILAYDKIKSYDYSGRVMSQLTITGDTSIITVENFSVFARRVIWQKFKQLGIKNNLGKTYKASLRYRRHNTKLLVGPENVIAKRDNNTEVLSYPAIYSCKFKKPHFFSLFGDFTLRGRRVDARAGEGGDIVMTVNHMFVFTARKAKRHIESKIAEMK